MAHGEQPIPGLISYSHDATGSAEEPVRQEAFALLILQVYSLPPVWRQAVTYYRRCVLF